MPLKLIRADITAVSCHAIVNAANSSLLGGGGVDGMIHRAAGNGLLAECRRLGGCAVGEAKITGGYRLPCRYVIHTVGPVWQGGGHGEEALLRSCYRASLTLAREHQCESVAFPLISSGAFGYPKDRALKVAVEEITDFLLENEMLVYLVIFDRASFQIGGKLFDEIASFIDDRYVRQYADSASVLAQRMEKAKKTLFGSNAAAAPAKPAANAAADFGPQEDGMEKARKQSLEEALRAMDESFSEMLLRKIDEKGMTDAQCYKKANIDRKLFSKIRGNAQYRPSKTTALAFAIALELPLAETEELLKKAGFALSHSSKADLIVEYFIQNGNYDIFEINEALFAFDQSLLGA